VTILSSDLVENSE